MILVIIPAAVIAAASLASFAGRWVWWLDVLANFRAQYVVVLALLGGIVVISRWRRSGVAILAVAVVNLIFVAPLYLGSPGESDPAAPHLLVLSFNLLSTNENYNEVIEYIKTVDADLVFLHEASRPWEVALEAAELDYEIIRARSDNLIFGTVVLARDEVEAVSHGFAEAQPRAVELDYQPEGWPVPVEVLSTHTLAPTTRRASLASRRAIGFRRRLGRRTGRRLLRGRRPQRDTVVVAVSQPDRSRVNCATLKSDSAFSPPSRLPRSAFSGCRSITCFTATPFWSGRESWAPVSARTTSRCVVDLEYVAP